MLRVFVRYFAPKFIGEYSGDRSRPTYGPKSADKTAPSQLTSKLQEKKRSHSTYGRMEHSETNSEVELEERFPKVWSECHRASMLDNVSHLEDIEPSGRRHDNGKNPFSTDIVVTKTFGP